MKNRINKDWYLTSPDGISRYLFKVFKDWGFYAHWNPSDDSESLYIKIQSETGEVKHIRISNHSIPPKNQWTQFDEDVYCGFEREGAKSYIKLLTKLAGELNKPLPYVLERVKAGTHPYKLFRIEMQRRRKFAGKNGRVFTGERLYV